MANSIVAGNRIVIENNISMETIRLKDKKHVIMQVADKKYESDLEQGDTVTVQQFPNLFGNMGGTAGASITESDWAIQSFNVSVDKVYQNARNLKDIEALQSNLNLVSEIADRYAFGSANNDDQFVASFFTEADSNNKVNDKAPVTLSSTNTYSNVVAMKQALEEQNADTDVMLFVSPAIASKFRLENILDSTDNGLDMRLNGEVGKFDGFTVMKTNNLPHVRTLTLDTQPTAGDTFTIAGSQSQSTSGTGGFAALNVTFTIVAAGAAAAAGEVALGATLADTQQNIIDAVNGTGTPGASTYFELASADRVALENGFTNLGAFTSDVATLRTALYSPATETFTAGTNVFGVDAVLMAAVAKDAISFVGQMDKFKITDAETGFFSRVLQEKIYGGAVLGENAKGIATNEVVTGNA